MTHPDDHQVGGDHYRKVSGEQHWTRIYRLFGPGYFIGCITKYVERYKEKGGKQDLEKAIHFTQKLITLEYPDGHQSSLSTEHGGLHPQSTDRGPDGLADESNPSIPRHRDSAASK